MSLPSRPVPAGRSPRLGLLAALVLAGSSLGCTSTPPLPPEPCARIESIPAGARCVTSDGEVFTTPAVVPLARTGVLRFEMTLPGHEPRKLLVKRPQVRPTLASFGAFGLVQLIADGGWEVVEPNDGNLVVTLEPER